LRKLLHKGEVTSEDLVDFYGKRCYQIGRKLNLTTVEHFEKAKEIAKKCDIERDQAIKSNSVDNLPYFHGIPFSVKD
jgi:fatty acid amide hydrolase